MIGGVVSVTLLHTLYVLAPSLRCLDESYFSKFFLSIGLLEEFAKYIMFFVMMLFIKKNKVSKHPFRYMFYFSMVGLGFAIVENVGYVEMFGENVLYIRTFSSTIAHMLFGMFFGYWIGLSKIYRRKFQDRSVFGVLTNRYKKLKLFSFTIIGFLFAVIYHGMWNYNLKTSGDASTTIMMILILFGLLSSKLLANNLNNQWRKSLRSNKKINELISRKIPQSILETTRFIAELNKRFKNKKNIFWVASGRN